MKALITIFISLVGLAMTNPVPDKTLARRECTIEYCNRFCDYSGYPRGGCDAHGKCQCGFREAACTADFCDDFCDNHEYPRGGCDVSYCVQFIF
ncbi:hypothetical protein V8C42DRAFT_305533 [Trichoderma barbatum]